VYAIALRLAFCLEEGRSGVPESGLAQFDWRFNTNDLNRLLQRLKP
jgi:hypothetical protein